MPPIVFIYCLYLFVTVLPLLQSRPSSPSAAPVTTPQALTHVAWAPPEGSPLHYCPDTHPCCQTVAAQPWSAPLYVDVVHARRGRGPPTFVLTRGDVEVRTPAFATGTGRGRYDATNLPVRVLEALYSDGDLRAIATVPWRLFYDRHARRGATWLAWTTATPGGDECVLSASG